MNPMPDPLLETAYRNTDYRVDDGPFGPFTIRIGEVCGELEELLFGEVAFDWAFVTACNPGSRPLSAARNAQRMADLEEFVRAHGWRYYHGGGVGRTGNWPPEPSLLVIGIPQRDAVELARRFGQNAIVAGRTGERARLVWVGS